MAFVVVTWLNVIYALAHLHFQARERLPRTVALTVCVRGACARAQPYVEGKGFGVLFTSENFVLAENAVEVVFSAVLVREGAPQRQRDAAAAALH